MELCSNSALILLSSSSAATVRNELERDWFCCASMTVLNQVCFNVESQLANVLSVVGNPVPLFYGSPATGKLIFPRELRRHHEILTA
jgi:hypothetical protein